MAMDESDSPSWKGHSFTLLVFGGIVVLCSIFFVLGMLVGRNQGQRMAEMAAADDATRKSAAQPLPDSQPLNFFTKTTEEVPDDTLQIRPAPPTTAEGSEPDPIPAPLKEPAAADKPYWQITATTSSDEAKQALNKVQSKGFRARILSPDPAGPDKFYRVLVGPYDTEAEAEMAKQDLKAQGYKDLFRK
jgi:cell division septation protein DedD